MEQWRIIDEFPQYEVSNKGKVRNAKTKRILRTNRDEKGRERLILYKDGKQHSRKIRRLVAEAFCEQYYDDLYVMNIDGDITNNDSDNLEWRFLDDINKHYNKIRPHRNKLTKRVLCMETGIVYDSIQQASKDMNMSRTAISRIINARSYSSKDGYHFIWVD